MARLPPKPASRPDNAGLLARIRMFRQDMFSSQPARLYRAWMAEARGPFYRSFLVNDPALVQRILVEDQPDFPKSAIIHDTLHGLLGDSVFVTNGPQWERQRRIINSAFEGSLKSSFPAMLAAGNAAITRLAKQANGRPIEMEYVTSYLAADVIFRTLFSIPITSDAATKVFDEFRVYQRASPCGTFRVCCGCYVGFLGSGHLLRGRVLRIYVHCWKLWCMRGPRKSQQGRHLTTWLHG